MHGDFTAPETDPSPHAASEVNHPAADSNVAASHLGPPDPQLHLSAQKDKYIANKGSPSSNTQRSYVDIGTQTDGGLPITETEIPATQDSTSKMKLPAAGSKWLSHCYPFDTLPVLRSHALPHFALLNAGEKLSKAKLQHHAVAVALIFKIDEYKAMESLTKMYKIYCSWVKVVVPSKFYSKAPQPTSKDKMQSGGGQEEGNAAVSGTLEGAVDILDHIHARTEQDDGPKESDRGKRASDHQKDK